MTVGSSEQVLGTGQVWLWSNAEVEKPSDWGLPHDRFRPHQLPLIHMIVDTPEKWIIIESPTGTGKTALAAAVGSKYTTTAIVETRDLQQQYADLYDFRVVWGREHYPCVSEEVRNTVRNPTAAECPLRREQRKEALCYSDCPYEKAKRVAKESRKRILNYAYAWWTNWWRDSTYLFLDEGHLLPAICTQLASVEISERTRVEFNLPPFPHLIGSSAFVIQRALEWVGAALREVHYLLAKRGSVDAPVDPRWAVKLVSLQQKLSWMQEALTPDEWYLVCHPGRKWSAKPIWPTMFMTQLGSGGQKHVIMSATIGDPGVLAELLGIGSYVFKSVPHSFPPENRPIYLHPDAPRISARSSMEDYFRQAKLIVDLAKKHSGERGLIHTASWYHTQILQKYLIELGLEDRLWVLDPKKDRVEQVEWLKHCDKDDLIAMGPSFTEGISLDDDLCRWIVIAKVPWKDLNDPIIQVRLKREFGRSVYDWEACLDVVQAAGRGVRNERDYAVTYILDRNFTRVKRFLPPWVNYIE